MFLSKFQSCRLGALLMQCSVVLTAVSLSNVAVAQNAPSSAPLDHAKIDEVLGSLNRGRSVGQVAISPDGKRVAWVQSRRDAGDILVAAIDDLTKTERVSAGVQADQHCR